MTLWDQQSTSLVEWRLSEGTTEDDRTVYCDVQMPLAQGRELLQSESALRESNTHPTHSRIFERMQYELSISIDINESSPT
jgi:hypothetical protein